MGWGSYDVNSGYSRAATVYSTKSREETFSGRFDDEMNPKLIKKPRESRDRDGEESYPIIIALDETGSMGHVPELLIKNVLPKIMESILNAGIKNPQICFMGIGDSVSGYEDAPLQVGQFESDERIEKWLTMLYLEGLGAGNGHESYPLAWYFADRHVVTDAWEKRGIKGVLITIGDEPCQMVLTKRELNQYIDKSAEEVYVPDLLNSVKERWNIFHIHCDGTGTYSFKNTNWESLLGINAVVSTDPKGYDIGDIIPSLIVSCYENR